MPRRSSLPQNTNPKTEPPPTPPGEAQRQAPVPSASELRRRTDEYFEQTRVATLTGLALCLGVTLEELRRGETKTKTHGPALKNARDRLFVRLEEMLYDPNRKSAIGPIFALKSLAGWDDGAGRRGEERSGGLGEVHRALAARSGREAAAPPQPQESARIGQNRPETGDAPTPTPPAGRSAVCVLRRGSGD